MATVAEDMGRLANEIAAGRRERSKLATEIKVATNRRRSDVELFLQSAKSARVKATRDQAERRQQTAKARHLGVFSMLLGEQTSRRRAGSLQAAEAKKMTNELHREVSAMLRGQKASRIRAARVSHKEAVDVNTHRQREVKAMLDQFAREGVARQQRRQELAGAQRKQAAAFMIDLTDGVDAFRDKLARAGRDRAAEIRDHLSAYAHDRREGMAIWRGNFQRSRLMREQLAHARHSAAAQSAAPPTVQDKPAAAPRAPVNTHGTTAAFAKPEARADKAKAPQPAPARQTARHPKGRHGGHAK